MDEVTELVLRVNIAIQRLSLLERRAAAGDEKIDIFNKRLEEIEQRLDRIQERESFG